jgi:hypothetical protein
VIGTDAPDPGTMSGSGAATDGWAVSGLAVPRQAAVGNLESALARFGFSERAAEVIAGAAARPDEVRRRLAEPVSLRVPGGVIGIVDTLVWSNAITPFPTNPREMGSRRYPLAAQDGNGFLIGEPQQTPGHLAELSFRVPTRQYMVDRLRDAEEWLRRHNPLTADVAAEGILQPITLVASNVMHADRTAPITMLAAADGSSRTSAAHAILGVDVAKVAYASDGRWIRQENGRQLKELANRSWEDLTEKEQEKLRALVAPARLVVSYQADPGRNVTFDQAVRALIGLTHIRPPKPYGRAVERDAMADAVLDTLSRPIGRRSPVITEVERDWLAGRLTQAERDSNSLPSEPDVRAAEIIRTLLYGGRATAVRVNRGIRALTAEQRPSSETRTDIVVELILRTVRTEHATDSSYAIQARRAAFQRTYRLPEISQQPSTGLLEGTSEAPLSLAELRAQALAELDDPDRDDHRLGEAQTELAIKAAYYMITADPMALRRELIGRDDEEEQDERALSVVLRAMLNTAHGIHQAYSVIQAGRAGRRLHEVDEGGKFTKKNGHYVALTDPLVRETYTGDTIGSSQSGMAAAARHWNRVTTAVEALENSVIEMSRVEDVSGLPVVETYGWPKADISELRNRIDRIDRALADWGDRHSDRHSQ